LLVSALLAGSPQAAVAARAAARARGTDRATAIAVGRALLSRPLTAQLVAVRCEKFGGHRICGLVVSGVKFKHPLDRQSFLAEVRALIEGAFAHAPLEEVDLWTTVPLHPGQGIVVGDDLAIATTATVFAVTVPRAALPKLGAQLESGHDVFWDASFADSLAKGT
jgi:hypothetical protein